MKIFVTGASGFVGGAATRRLVAEGHTVVAMSRSEKSDAAISALRATPVRCNLDDVSAPVMAGCEVVLHCAAHVEAWGDPDVWDRINVKGTERMLQAAKQAHVRRFIHIGTEAALVHGQHLRNVDEDQPLAIHSPYPYCRTKALAEQAVRRANDPDADFVTIVLRPRFIWGPGDLTLLPTMLEFAAQGKWMWIDGGRALTSTTYIGNLVEGIVLALSKGMPGQAYFVLDEGQRSMHDIITAMADCADVKLPSRSMPGWLAEGIGAVCEFVWRSASLKGTPPLTRHAAMVMAKDCTLRGDKAAKELGYVPKFTVEQGLAELRKTFAKS